MIDGQQPLAISSRADITSGMNEAKLNESEQWKPRDKLFLHEILRMMPIELSQIIQCKTAVNTNGKDRPKLLIERRKCNESITELILNPSDVIQILMHPMFYD